MTQLLLEVPQSQSLPDLLALFERLNLRVVQKPEAQKTAKTAAKKQATASEAAPVWAAAVKPLRQSQSIEEMKQEQRYKGFDRAEFDRLIEALDVQDPDGNWLKLLRA